MQRAPRDAQVNAADQVRCRSDTVLLLGRDVGIRMFLPVRADRAYRVLRVQPALLPAEGLGDLGCGGGPVETSDTSIVANQEGV